MDEPVRDKPCLDLTYIRRVEQLFVSLFARPWPEVSVEKGKQPRTVRLLP